MSTQEDSSGVLAESLFSQGFADNAEKHLQKAKEDLKRGATDQASEHLRRGLLSNARALTSLTSPRLTEEENAEFLRLQKLKYSVSEEGIISEKELGKYNENRLLELQRKAFAENDDGTP